MIRSYFDTGEPASSIEIVVSQDSFTHASTEHCKAIKEAARVLQTGGIFVFTDLMRSVGADEAKLAEVQYSYYPLLSHGTAQEEYIPYAMTVL